jgi:hypothetical protein
MNDDGDPRAVPSMPGDVPDDRLSALFARARDATDDLRPPPSFAARVMAAAGARRGTWAQVGSLGRLAVPCAAIAAAAALLLAWSGDRPDGAAIADDMMVVP